MKVKIKRFDKTIPLPSYKSKGAVCVDLYSRQTITIESQQIGYVPLNLAVQIPKGYWLMVVSRGSTHKMGLMMANSLAVGDEDFCGDNDEYVFPAFNFTDHKVVVEKGTRMAQMMIMKYDKMEFKEVEKLGNPNRGMLGSTGSK